MSPSYIWPLPNRVCVSMHNGCHPLVSNSRFLTCGFRLILKTRRLCCGLRCTTPLQAPTIYSLGECIKLSETQIFVCSVLVIPKARTVRQVQRYCASKGRPKACRQGWRCQRQDRGWMDPSSLRMHEGTPGDRNQTRLAGSRHQRP